MQLKFLEETSQKQEECQKTYGDYLIMKNNKLFFSETYKINIKLLLLQCYFHTDNFTLAILYI